MMNDTEPLSIRVLLQLHHKSHLQRLDSILGLYVSTTGMYGDNGVQCPIILLVGIETVKKCEAYCQGFRIM